MITPHGGFVATWFWLEPELGMSWNGDMPPVIIHLNEMFHDKPCSYWDIMGYPHFWTPLYESTANDALCKLDMNIVNKWNYQTDTVECRRIWKPWGSATSAKLHMEVFRNGGTPKWMIVMEHPIKKDDSGVPSSMTVVYINAKMIQNAQIGNLWSLDSKCLPAKPRKNGPRNISWTQNTISRVNDTCSLTWKTILG